MKETSYPNGDGKRRAEGIRRLANRIGCVNPNMISDPLLSLALGTPSLHPVWLEKWLVRRGQYDPDSGESIKGCLVRVYGQEWAELAESLI